MKPKKQRKLKVYSRMVSDRHFRDIGMVAEIRLMGRWLEQAEFKAGSDIMVEVKKGKLVIKLIS